MSLKYTSFKLNLHIQNNFFQSSDSKLGRDRMCHPCLWVAAAINLLFSNTNKHSLCHQCHQASIQHNKLYQINELFAFYPSSVPLCLCSAMCPNILIKYPSFRHIITNYISSPRMLYKISLLKYFHKALLCILISV